jgi:hypothetical protein
MFGSATNLGDVNNVDQVPAFARKNSNKTDRLDSRS